MQTRINERIIEVMMDENLSLTEFSRMIGVPDVCVYYWARNKQLPSTSNLVSICQTFGISADWLLFGEGDMRI